MRFYTEPQRKVSPRHVAFIQFGVSRVESVRSAYTMGRGQGLAIGNHDDTGIRGYMRAASFLHDILSTLFDRRTYTGVFVRDTPIEDQCRELLSSKGEVSGNRLAASLIAKYRTLDPDARHRFFEFLNDELDVDPAAAEEAARAYAEDRSAKALDHLQRVAEPDRQELLRRMNHVPGATADIVAMRTDLLKLLPDNPSLKRTDNDFRHLFASWFNRGFLVLRRIGWETPANILEKIIEYEAVHAINDWDDLRRRLEPPDRRCFAFFHPAIPSEPLVFVEVALVKGIPDSIQDLLGENREPLRPEDADTAVFYSISNCQTGLRGISFGNSLIKQVVEDLSRDFPHLKTFVTLSPVPGFSAWMTSAAADGDPAIGTLLEAAADSVAAGSPTDDLENMSDTARALCARYLTAERRPDGSPLDPVARFHLGNGATLHAIHALADVSANGLKQSGGVMVNYLYDLDDVEANHEAFAAEGKIATSDSVRSLARRNAKRAAKSAAEDASQ